MSNPFETARSSPPPPPETHSTQEQEDQEIYERYSETLRDLDQGLTIIKEEGFALGDSSFRTLTRGQVSETAKAVEIENLFVPSTITQLIRKHPVTPREKQIIANLVASTNRRGVMHFDVNQNVKNTDISFRTLITQDKKTGFQNNYPLSTTYIQQCIDELNMAGKERSPYKQIRDNASLLRLSARTDLHLSASQQADLRNPLFVPYEDFIEDRKIDPEHHMNTEAQIAFIALVVSENDHSEYTDIAKKEAFEKHDPVAALALLEKNACQTDLNNQKKDNRETTKRSAERDQVFSCLRDFPSPELRIFLETLLETPEFYNLTIPELLTLEQTIHQHSNEKNFDKSIRFLILAFQHAGGDGETMQDRLAHSFDSLKTPTNPSVNDLDTWLKTMLKIARNEETPEEKKENSYYYSSSASINERLRAATHLLQSTIPQLSKELRDQNNIHQFELPRRLKEKVEAIIRVAEKKKDKAVLRGIGSCFMSFNALMDTLKGFDISTGSTIQEGFLNFEPYRLEAYADIAKEDMK